MVIYRQGALLVERGEQWWTSKGGVEQASSKCDIVLVPRRSA